MKRLPQVYDLDEAAHRYVRDMLFRRDARGFTIPVPYTLRRVGTVGEGESDTVIGDNGSATKIVKTYERLYEVTYFEDELEQKDYAN